jgi:TonB-linked SusC/RagA family outer membrane protein
MKKNIYQNIGSHIVLLLLLNCYSATAQTINATKKNSENKTKSEVSNQKNDEKTATPISNIVRNNVGAASSIKGSDIESYPDLITGNALQGKLSGLMSIMNVGGLSNNNPLLYIRGLHRETGNNIITIVDGVERNINTLIPEEIDEIQILKDAVTKIMYGPRAANGVLIITTKRGQKNKRVIKANTEYGVGLPVAMPKFINSYDYARLYNEARVNDGLSPLYTPEDLTGYQKSTGANDFRYPNVDYYDYFLREQTEYRKFDFEFSGGNENAQYAFVGGYNGASGLQKVGVNPQRDRFNVRGNLDIKVNNVISTHIGIAGLFDVVSRGSLDHTQTFADLSTHRPNEYPIYIPENLLTPDSVGYPNLGAGLNTIDNLYGSLMYGGFQNDQDINGQLNFGMNLNLNDYVKGLTAKAMITFDNYFFGSQGITTTASTYSQRWIKTPDGRDSVILTMRKLGNKNDNMTLENSLTYRTSSILGSLNYARKFNNNEINADYVYNYYLAETTGESQDLKFINNVLKINFSNQNKYIAEANVAYMGSNKFIGDNQYTLSAAGGLGWIISDESFMKSFSKQIDYLKLKASAGVLAYDGQTPYNLNRDRYSDNGTVQMNNGLKIERATFNMVGNPNLKWEKSREINAGIEGLLFDKKVWVEANYFNELRYDIIQQLSSQYSAMLGGLYPYSNWGEVQNQGVEIDLKYSDKVDKLFYQLGTNIIYSKNKVIKTDEINYPEEYLKTVGKPADAMFGYVSRGLLGKDVDLNSTYPQQSFGTLQEGDIVYQDLNNDNIIDTRDREMLSNSFPRVHLSVDIKLSYNGFGLYILGTSQLGYSKWLNNSYYWNKGEDKYSDITLNRYHPTENPTGTYPRLTVSDGANNFRYSSFWLQNADFFRLKNVEFSYTIKQKKTSSLQNIKIYTRATNVFQISALRNLDPEVLNGGVTNYPVLKTITAGLSASF